MHLTKFNSGNLDKPGLASSLQKRDLRDIHTEHLDGSGLNSGWTGTFLSPLALTFGALDDWGCSVLEVGSVLAMVKRIPLCFFFSWNNW
jgi:hypothetical protein